MSIVFFDGFDLYNGTGQITRRGWLPNSANHNLQTGRFGVGQALQITNTNSNSFRYPFASDDTLTVGIAMKNSNLAGHNANGTDWLTFMDGSANVIVRIGLTSAGAIKAGRGDYTTNLICTSSNGVHIQDTWAYYEFELTRHASAGAINIYQNGVLIASASGVNTGASSIMMIGLIGNVDNKTYDDFYLLDVATRLGEMRCEVLRPTADTATKDFSRSTGSDNYALVDDTLADDDSTYNYSSTVGHKDLFDLGNLSSTPASIAAVQAILIARKDDAETRTIRTNLMNGSTETDGTTRALSSGYQMWSEVYNTNPDTGLAWTASGVNATQLGYEVVA